MATKDTDQQKKRIAENENAKVLYRRILDEGVLIRIQDVNWPLGYDEEETYIGMIRHRDSPFYMYFQDYDSHKPFERMLIQNTGKCVTIDQLPPNIKDKALRLPLKFSETEKIQLGEFVASSYHGACSDDWLLDGQRANAVQFPDGSIRFVGNGCWFEPISLDEAFANHEIYLDKNYYNEYKINGKRGYVKYERSDNYRLTGTSIEYIPIPGVIIDIVENPYKND